jgi:DNA uptake protein ComE-like DNA-binding protein
VVVDGVAFTAAEAAAALRFANEATAAELQAAGIAGRQASAVQAGRPYADLAAVGAAYGVGEKTMARLKTVGP